MSDNTIITQIQNVANIIGGAVFFANDNGVDPEHPNNDNLLPNGMYIRLEGSDGSVVYISAYEIDKAIGIIGDMSMGKANSSDLDSIRLELTNKASSIDVELLRSELESKANISLLDKYDDTINSKADKSVIDEIILVLKEKADKKIVTTLREDISKKADIETLNDLSYLIQEKASTNTVTSLQNDVKNLQSALNSLTDKNSIIAINNQIEYLNNEIKKKLTSNDLTSINTSINNLYNVNETFREKINTIETNLNKKASIIYVQGQVNELNHAITGLAKSMEDKANKSIVDLKANKADVDKLVKSVTTLSTNVKNALDDFNTTTDSLKSEMDAKISDIELSRVETDINDLAINKANKVDVDNSINKLSQKLNALEVNNSEVHTNIYQKIDDLDCNINNELLDIRYDISTCNKNIDNQSTQISKLQESDVKINEKLRNEWVRVMTPEEYKRLAPVGDKYSDGTLNPYAKQANTIYMLVKYNKPVAVYIGEILIAQAEQKGSVGFAYTFPIVF